MRAAFVLPFLLGACAGAAPDDGAGDSGAGDSGAGDSGAGDSGAGDSGAVHMVSLGGGGGATVGFVGEYVEEDCPVDCEGNTAPGFSGPDVLVNGVWDPVPAPRAGDTLAVGGSYADAECNLACGAAYYAWSGPMESEADAGSLPSNLPCDTVSSGVYLGFDFGVVEAGEYTWSLRLEDACGAESAQITGSITVAP